MKDEKLSVIMGVWNPDRQMLEQAVQSILSQTFSDFCFYICDDGSTNGAYEWLRQYARGDGRIRPLRHEQNRGLACALNTCLAHCRGEYVARQDADDFSLPTV
jgi:glycosyltransferase involved in cell wall biosynthesis